MGKSRARAKSLYVDPKEREELEKEYEEKPPIEEEAATQSPDVEYAEENREKLIRLLDSVMGVLPDVDNSSYKMRLHWIKWNNIEGTDYKPDEMKSEIENLLKRIRTYRNLREMIVDARESLVCGIFHCSAMKKGKTNPYFLFRRDAWKELNETRPDLTPKEKTKLIGERYSKLSKTEKESYTELARLKNIETFGEGSLYTGRSKADKDLPYRLVNRRKIGQDYPEPVVPYDFYVAKQMLKGSMETKQQLKDKWALLSKKTKVKYILKAMRQTMGNGKNVISYAERKLLDEYEGRPEPPLKAFANFVSENKNLSIQAVAEKWKDIPKEEKERRTAEAHKKLKEYKRQIKEFMGSLSAERREIEEYDIKLREKLKKPCKPRAKSQSQVKKEAESTVDQLDLEIDEAEEILPHDTPQKKIRKSASPRISSPIKLESLHESISISETPTKKKKKTPVQSHEEETEETESEASSSQRKKKDRKASSLISVVKIEPPPIQPESSPTRSDASPRKRKQNAADESSHEWSSASYNEASFVSPQRKKKKFLVPESPAISIDSQAANHSGDDTSPLLDPPTQPTSSCSAAPKKKIKREPEERREFSPMLRTDESSYEERFSLNNSEGKKKKKKKKKKKNGESAEEPPKRIPQTTYDYFCEFVFKGSEEKREKAWAKVTKDEKKEYLSKIRELNAKYMEDLEIYLNKLNPKEMNKFSNKKEWRSNQAGF